MKTLSMKTSLSCSQRPNKLASQPGKPTIGLATRKPICLTWRRFSLASAGKLGKQIYQ